MFNKKKTTITSAWVRGTAGIFFTQNEAQTFVMLMTYRTWGNTHTEYWNPGI
jgi:hypothetical protein